MVYSTYRFALLTFNLLCSIEAMKESFVGGDSMVDAYGAEDKGQKLQVSLGEHDTGHGETENEANGEDVAFVEVTASGALTTIARPHNSSLVEAVQADEAELAGEAEQDEDAEETDEVDGAKLTGEAEKAKEAENDQPDPLMAAAMAAHPMPTLCFPCIDKGTGYIFCKDTGKEQCWGSDSATGFADCMVYVKRDGQSAQVNVKTSVSSSLPVPPAGITTTVNVPAAINFDDCGVTTGPKKGPKKMVFCEEPSDSCTQKSCNAFCATAGKFKEGKPITKCENRKGRVGASKIVSGWVCGDKGQKLQLEDPTGCYKDRNEARKVKCTKIVTASAMGTDRSPQFNDPTYASCKTAGSECKNCIDKEFQVYCMGK